MSRKRKYRDVESMTDEEFEKLLDEVAGERVEKPEPVRDPRFTERNDNPTPSGGDYSIAYYYNDDGPCEKSKANRVNIVEYKKGSIRINETYALLNRDGIKRLKDVIVTDDNDDL
ncbi:MAG: hypothetical protein IJV45_02310 [Prevotella sp.]|nr:hypothetical protein [Prevotella sp.]